MKDTNQLNLRQKSSAAFTLIEIMIGIAIIAIITIIGLVVLKNVQDQARLAKVQADFHAMSQQIELARESQDKLLKQITGSVYSAQPCVLTYSNNTQIRDIPGCVASMQAVWNLIIPGAKMPMDPWGNPYLIDENEGEKYWADGTNAAMEPIGACVPDRIFSAGPSGVMYLGQPDTEISYHIPFKVTLSDEYSPNCLFWKDAGL